MSKFEMYQSVRIVRLPPDFDISLPYSGMRAPVVGDTGIIVEILTNPEEMYVVQAALPNGKTAWMAPFMPDELDADPEHE